MYTKLFLKDEKVIAESISGLTVFTNRRILVSKELGGQPTSILLESIKRLELVYRRSTVLGVLTTLLFFSAVGFIFLGNIMLFALAIFAMILSLAMFLFRAKQVLRICADKHKNLTLNAKEINDNLNDLLNQIESARFERLNQLFKSNAKAKDAENPKTIKISA